MLQELRIQRIPGDEAVQVVDPFYEREGKSHRARPSDLFFVAFIAGQVVGVCRFCIEEKTPMLRSMVVDSSMRSQKIGAQILKNFESYLDDHGFGPTYCIPYAHLGKFYGLIGFQIIEEHEAPAFLQERIRSYREKSTDQFMFMRRA